MHGPYHHDMTAAHEYEVKNKEADNDGFMIEANSFGIEDPYQAQYNQQHNRARQDTTPQPIAQRKPISF